MKRFGVAALAGAVLAALAAAPAARADAGPVQVWIDSGYHSPVQGTVTLVVHARTTDPGATLGTAALTLNGAAIPGAAGGLACAAQPCTDGTATLSFDSTQYPDGPYVLAATAADSHGHSGAYGPPSFEIWNHRPVPTRSATLTIGSGVPTPPASGGGTGGVAGATAASCSRPRLSVVLDQKPLRIRHGVPVLKRGKRYRFRGRLTCVVHHKRVSAPKRTRIDRLDKVGRRMVHKGGALVRGHGRLTFIVPALSSRTLIFRFINGDRRLDVKIKIKVARR